MEGPRSKPLVTIALLWGVVLLLSTYGGVHVAEEAAKSELFGNQLWAHDMFIVAAKAGDAVGLGAVRRAVQELRAPINEAYLVLEAGPAVIDAPPDAGVAAVDAGPAPAGELVHHGPVSKTRVLVIGASSIQFAVGVEFQKRLPRYEGVRVLRYGKLATGLARPDFFDWPKKTTELARKFRPDLIIANFGGNGAQDIPIGDYEKVKFGTDEWNRRYTERVKEIVGIARENGADFVFMGMPIMGDERFSRKMEIINRVQRAAAEAAGADWIATWEMAADADGKYRKSVEYEGKRGLMRMSDGVHYKALGAKFIVDNVMQNVERLYRLVPDDPAFAVAERHAFDSPALQRRVSYVAFVPKSATPEKKAPAVYLFVGDRWKTWPAYPHRNLQRWATRHGLVLIVLEEDPLHPDVFTDELVKDVEAHLPVLDDRRGLVGPDVEKLSEALPLPHRFEPGFEKLSEVIDWQASQLNEPLP